jgi:hypothetical protein
MTPLKSILLSTIFSLTVLCSFSQEQIEKIRDKNLIGEWYSKDSITSLKVNSVVTFYKNPTRGFKDSLITFFRINKNGSLRIVKKTSLKSISDSVLTNWLFIEQSKNLKITDRGVQSQVLIIYRDANGNNALKPHYIDIIRTMHVDFISEDKMILKYLDLK